MPPDPYYDLDQIKYLLRVRQFDITREAGRTASDLGITEDDLYDLIRELTPVNLYKTMPAEDERFKGHMQDVYHVEFEGRRVYLKLQLLNNGDFLRVISCKENEHK